MAEGSRRCQRETYRPESLPALGAAASLQSRPGAAKASGVYCKAVLSGFRASAGAEVSPGEGEAGTNLLPLATKGHPICGTDQGLPSGPI